MCFLAAHHFHLYPQIYCVLLEFVRPDYYDHYPGSGFGADDSDAVAHAGGGVSARVALRNLFAVMQTDNG